MTLRYPAFWQEHGWRSGLLTPLGWLYCRVSAKRRRNRALNAQSLPVPVVVVGNISVGGTGKTPVVLALIQALRARGYTPGVISRGFGARPGDAPVVVGKNTRVDQCGDEPWLIFQQTNVPLAVHPKRFAAGKRLLAASPEVDLIIADDGFQHHHLARTVDWVVIDAQRKLGNQRCIPAGPLREHPRALNDADAVLLNGKTDWCPDFGPKPVQLLFELSTAVDVSTGQASNISALVNRVSEQRVLAVAGIGNPAAFFAKLAESGIGLNQSQALGDHEAVSTQQLRHWLQHFDVILMTQKDAVKLPVLDVGAGRVFSVQGQISLPDALINPLLQRLAQYSSTGNEYGQTSA